VLPEQPVQPRDRLDVLLVPAGGVQGLDVADATRARERLEPAARDNQGGRRPGPRPLGDASLRPDRERRS